MQDRSIFRVYEVTDSSAKARISPPEVKSALDIPIGRIELQLLGPRRLLNTNRDPLVRPRTSLLESHAKL